MEVAIAVIESPPRVKFIRRFQVKLQKFELQNRSNCIIFNFEYQVKLLQFYRFYFFQLDLESSKELGLGEGLLMHPLFPRGYRDGQGSPFLE